MRSANQRASIHGGSDRPADDPAQQAAQTRRHGGLERLGDQHRARARQRHHGAHEAYRFGYPERRQQLGQPAGQIRAITREQLIRPLPVEYHLDAVLVRQSHHAMLGVHGEAAERLALHCHQPVDIVDDLIRLDPHHVALRADRPRGKLDIRRFINLRSGRREAERPKVELRAANVARAGEDRGGVDPAGQGNAGRDIAAQMQFDRFEERLAQFTRRKPGRALIGRNRRRPIADRPHVWRVERDARKAAGRQTVDAGEHGTLALVGLAG